MDDDADDDETPSLRDVILGVVRPNKGDDDDNNGEPFGNGDGDGEPGGD